MVELDEIVKDFLADSAKTIDQITRDLDALRDRPDDVDVPSRLLRTVHTLKGNCGFLALRRLENLAHAGETVLAGLRDGETAANDDSIAALFSMHDAIRTMIASVAATGSDGDDDHSALVACLSGISGSARSGIAEHADPPRSDAAQHTNEAASAAVFRDADGRTASEVGCAQDGERVSPGNREPASSGARSTFGVADETIRIRLRLVDEVRARVESLAVSCDDLRVLVGRWNDPALEDALLRIDRSVNDVRASVSRLHLQPLDSLTRRISRLAHDLARSVGKTVRFEADLGGIEIDRALLEAIQDPLTHMIRNAIDHGIERPDVRRAKGKSEQGSVRVRAFRDEHQVVIELADDGAGIPVSRLKRKAIERGLIDALDAERLSERRLLELIFLPGLSTAEKVSSVSGRGVGMDVVKHSIEKVGGQIEIMSRPDIGTTFRISIPCTSEPTSN